MKNNKKILKLIGGICTGMGIGVCFGISFDNLIVGLMLGVGIGMCFAVSFGAFKEDETEGCPKETKEKDTEEASEDIPSEKS